MKAKDLFLSFEKRRSLNHERKQQIARRALDLIKQEDEIFLGAGTTVSFLGEDLARSPKHFMLKIWTNNLFLTSLWLSRYDRMFSENFIGITAGEISRKNLSIVNLMASFSQIEKAIIGTPGVSGKGLTSDDVYTVQQIEFLIHKVKKVIILAGGSKVGRECTYLTRSMHMIKLDIKNGKEYTLITDAGSAASDQQRKNLKRLQEAGINIFEV